MNDSAVTSGPAGRGSVSDHLANERTHLAYVRTSIALFAFGITLHQFSVFATAHRQLPAVAGIVTGRHVGLGMVILGILLAAWSAHRFNQVTRDIERATYRPNRAAMRVIALSVVIIGVAGAGWLLGT